MCFDFKGRDRGDRSHILWSVCRYSDGELGKKTSFLMKLEIPAVNIDSKFGDLNLTSKS